MNKEQEIKEISKMAITMGGCHFESCLECKRQANCPHCYLFEQGVLLHKAGYGDKKQAVKDFIDSFNDVVDLYGREKLKARFTELYGAD